MVRSSTYTSIYVKKVAPKYHKVLTYTTKKIREDSIDALFKEMRIVPVNYMSLQKNKPIPLFGDYNWMNLCQIGHFPASIVHYQLSLFQQRLNLLEKTNFTLEQKRATLQKNPPVLIMSIPYPLDDYPINLTVNYLRGLILSDNKPPLYIFSTCFPYVLGSRYRIGMQIEKMSDQLKIKSDVLMRLLFSMPKYLVALEKDQSRYCNVDLMTIPQTYDIKKETIFMYSPQLNAKYRGNFTTSQKSIYSKTYLNDFDGLDKYSSNAHPKKILSLPSCIEDLIDLNYGAPVDKLQPESLSDFLYKSYRDRLECRVYGKPFGKNIPKMAFMSNEIKEHARTELSLFKKSLKGVKNSLYSKSHVNPPRKKKIVKETHP